MAEETNWWRYTMVHDEVDHHIPVLTYMALGTDGEISRRIDVHIDGQSGVARAEDHLRRGRTSLPDQEFAGLAAYETLIGFEYISQAEFEDNWERAIKRVAAETGAPIAPVPAHLVYYLRIAPATIAQTPVIAYTEYDEHWVARRQLHIYKDGTTGIARLSDLFEINGPKAVMPPVEPVQEINTDTLLSTVITPERFEHCWALALERISGTTTVWSMMGPVKAQSFLGIERP